MTQQHRAESWCRMLRSVAEPVARTIDLTAPFSDDFGHTREVDKAFVVWCRASEPARTKPHDSTANPGTSKFHVEHNPPPRTAVTEHARAEAVDAALWRALALQSNAAHVDHLLAQARDANRTTWDSGALIPQGTTALEVWTETDLCCLHALWWLARNHARADWAKLANDAATWHLENVQPDNATAHPWALHLFALRDIASPNGDGAARLHAEMMMHNCQVSLGRADKLSALILLDAARGIGEACSV
jgi:hypothetical protein